MGDIADMAAEDEYFNGPYGTYEPGHIEMPGGWCIPKSQAPEPFTFPRIQRGGIKYPKPTKETYVPEPRMTKAQIAHELQSNAQLQEMLRQRRLELQQLERKAIPAEPLNYLMFTVAVRFKMRGKRYQYLILRNGNAYFTTGTNTGQKMFPDWEALVAWLEGPEVYSHSDFEILQSAGKVVSFDTGAIERMDPSDQKPPF